METRIAELMNRDDRLPVTVLSGFGAGKTTLLNLSSTIARKKVRSS